MARTGSWVMRSIKGGKLRLVPKHKAKPRTLTPVRGVISDYLPDMIHPCTGKRMDSKSEFRKVTKAKGAVEVGNEKMIDRRVLTEMDSESRKKDIDLAMKQLGI